MEETLVPEVVESMEVIAPVVEPEKEYRYQPTDENGRKLGGEQVIKYTTQEELVKKITDQNVHLVRALREQTKKQRLGIVEQDTIPDESPKFDNPLEFKPRQLSPDERVALSRDLLDPEKFEEAASTMFEATIGAKPEVLRDTLSRLSQTELNLLAKVESDAFMQSTPEYYPCMENYLALADWMVKNNLKPVRQNFKLAFDTLTKDGVLLGKPEVVPVETPVAPVVEPEPVIEPVEPIVEPVVETRVPPPTGLRGGNDNITIVKKQKYTLADINKMSGEEYKKKLLSEKGFAEAVEALEKEAADRNRKRN